MYLSMFGPIPTNVGPDCVPGISGDLELPGRAHKCPLSPGASPSLHSGLTAWSLQGVGRHRGEMCWSLAPSSPLHIDYGPNSPLTLGRSSNDIQGSGDTADKWIFPRLWHITTAHLHWCEKRLRNQS